MKISLSSYLLGISSLLLITDLPLAEMFQELWFTPFSIYTIYAVYETLKDFRLEKN
jgi:hypothetical protein